MKLPFLALYLLLNLIYISAVGQTQEDFIKKYSEVFIHKNDSVKAREYSMEAYQMVEDNEGLQTLENYYTLVAMFTSGYENEELAQLCQKKANAKLEFNTSPTLQKPDSYDSPDTEWTYEYQIELYKSKDRGFGRKAQRFLEEHESLQNFTNYSAVAQFYKSQGDFNQAEVLYEQALNNIDWDNNEFVSIFSPALFYLDSGQFEKVEELAELNEKLLQQADQYTKTAYEASKDQLEL